MKHFITKHQSHARHVLTYALLLPCLALMLVAHSTAQAPTEPRETTSRFYAWYLHALASDHDPIRDDKSALSRYVSSSLIAEIERRINSADGLEADYFIQAQDYMDDWEGNILVSEPEIKDDTARVAVTLGTNESLHKLKVALIKEKGVWKIRSVRALKL